jgi:hypothetical protein
MKIVVKRITYAKEICHFKRDLSTKQTSVASTTGLALGYNFQPESGFPYFE